MTEQDKQLLLKDLCSRLPYGVILANGIKARSIDILTKIVSGIGTDKKIEDTKYYLRPMSSMTQDERMKMLDYTTSVYRDYHQEESDTVIYQYKLDEYLDWLNEHHFDYRGLIEKGLALKATENMYQI